MNTARRYLYKLPNCQDTSMKMECLEMLINCEKQKGLWRKLQNYDAEI
jgi:hypothetical protein